LIGYPKGPGGHFGGHLGTHLYLNPENDFSRFLDSQNLCKDTKFITSRQIPIEFYWVYRCGGHLGRHIELQLSAPHLDCLPKFLNLLWTPYKDQESKFGDIKLHKGSPQPQDYSETVQDTV